MSATETPRERTMSDPPVRTVADVERELDALRAVIGDDEVAHSAEDALYRSVLRSIADGTAERPDRMAALALRTQDYDFARWCA